MMTIPPHHPFFFAVNWVVSIPEFCFSRKQQIEKWGIIIDIYIFREPYIVSSFFSVGLFFSESFLPWCDSLQDPKELGQGAFGVTYLAQKRDTSEKVSRDNRCWEVGEMDRC